MIYLEDTLYEVQNHTLPKIVDKVTADPADTNTVAMTAAQFKEKAGSGVYWPEAANNEVKFYVDPSWNADRTYFDQYMDTLIHLYYGTAAHPFIEVGTPTEADWVMFRCPPQTTPSFNTTPEGYTSIIGGSMQQNLVLEQFIKETIERASGSGNVQSWTSSASGTPGMPTPLCIRIQTEKITNQKNMYQNNTEKILYWFHINDNFK